MNEIPLGFSVVARMDDSVIRIFFDSEELFNFPKDAVSFEKEPLAFLLQIYRAGFARGRMVGKEILKARIRELLGVDL